MVGVFFLFCIAINYSLLPIHYPLTLSEEKEIIDLTRKDPQAFGILFDEYYPQIFGYIHRRVIDWDVSKDIASEVFLKAFTHLKDFKWLGISIAAWFYRIATNEINLYFRHNKYSPTSLNQLLDFHDFDTEEDNNERQKAEQQIKEYQDFLQIQSELKKLSTKYQEVISLRYFEEKSIKEIAEILNKNEGTVKSLISRGLEKIRQRIQ